MLAKARAAFSAPLAATVVLPLGEYVIRAYGSGARLEALMPLAPSFALSVAFALALSILGALAGASLAPLAGISRGAAITGCGLAGPATAALFTRKAASLAASGWPTAQILMWFAVWAAAGAVLTLASIGLESNKRWVRTADRLAAVLPVLLVAAALFLIPELPLALRVAGLVTAAALAVALVRRPSVAFPLNASMAAVVLAVPWIVSSEPSIDRAGRLIGGSGGALTPPRIILVSIDTLRADELGFSGGAVATPNLDRLAAESVVFDNAVSTSGWTLPALASIHLGLSPWVHGVTTGFGQPPAEPMSLAQRFSSTGYVTGKIGSNPFITEPWSGPALTAGVSHSHRLPHARAASNHRFRPSILDRMGRHARRPRHQRPRALGYGLGREPPRRPVLPLAAHLRSPSPLQSSRGARPRRPWTRLCPGSYPPGGDAQNSTTGGTDARALPRRNRLRRCGARAIPRPFAGARPLRRLGDRGRQRPRRGVL